MSSFAQRLRRLRKSRNLTQEALAEILDVSKSCISQYERTLSMPGPDILCHLSQYFGVSTDYLLGNQIPGLPIKLSDKFCKDVDYQTLLLQCTSLKTRNRRLLVDMLKSLASDLNNS